MSIKWPTTSISVTVQDIIAIPAWMTLFKELLRKFGADKLSDVAESDYTALLAEAKVIANAG